MKTYSGEYYIPAPRELVWQFLIDPQKVGPCLPDLLELEIIDQSTFKAVVRVGLGPIRGKFNLHNTLTIEEPGYSAKMTVKGGGMGSGINMNASMNLAEQENEGVLLTWSSDVVVSGPIATIGGRLIDGQAKKITEQVFNNIASEVLKLAEEEQVAAEVDVAEETVETETTSETKSAAEEEVNTAEAEEEVNTTEKGEQA